MNGSINFDDEAKPPAEPYRYIVDAILCTEMELGPPDQDSSDLFLRVVLMGAQGLTNTDEFRRLYDELHARRGYVVDPNAFSAVRLLGLRYTDVRTTPMKAAPTCVNQLSWAPFEVDGIDENKRFEGPLELQKHSTKTAAVLTHYTEKPWKVEMRPPEYYKQFFTIIQRSQTQMKPQGIWMSDDTAKVNWKSWCENEKYALDRLAYKTELLVDLSDNILLLDGSSVDAVEAFHSKYKFDTVATRLYENYLSQVKRLVTDCQSSIERNRDSDIGISKYECRLSQARKLLYEAHRKEPSNFNMIDWSKVMKEYKGILISPYDKGPFSLLGKHRHLFWFDSVDCSSACIWDVSCIIEVKPSRKMTDIPGLEGSYTKARVMQCAQETIGSSLKQRTVLGNISNTRRIIKAKDPCAPKPSSSKKNGLKKAQHIELMSNGDKRTCDTSNLSEGAPTVVQAKENVFVGICKDTLERKTNAGGAPELPKLVEDKVEALQSNMHLNPQESTEENEQDATPKTHSKETKVTKNSVRENAHQKATMSAPEQKKLKGQSKTPEGTRKPLRLQWKTMCVNTSLFLVEFLAAVVIIQVLLAIQG